MTLLRKRPKFLFIVLFVLIVAGLYLFQGGIKDFFYSHSFSLQGSLLNKGDGISDIWQGFSRAEELKKENEELKNKNQELISENNSLKQLREENETLRKALNVGLQERFRLSLAEVVNVDILRDYIVINKGSQDGLDKGMPVINEQNVLIGKISEVHDNFSRVILISNQDSFFPIRIKEKEVSATVRGKGGYLLSLQEVPREGDIEEGDIAITTSLGRDFPEGLLVGEVSNVKKSDVENFHSGEIIPFFEIGEIKKVFVIINF